jgi:lysophospholipase L1-like esterase
MSLMTIIPEMSKTGVLLPPPGGDYFSADTGDITFTDDHFQYSLPSYDKTGGYKARSPYGFVQFRTSETSISVKVAGDWIGQGVESKCEVFVDGVWNQSVQVTVSNTIQTVAITLPAGEKIVTVQNGYNAGADSTYQSGVNRPASGVWVQGIVTTGPIEIKRPVTVANKALFVGDSITTGASSPHTTATGFPQLFRQSGWNVQVDSWGARILDTDTDLKASNMATQLVAQMTGTGSNDLFMMLGTNNFNLDHTKTMFKDRMQKLFDAIHALNASIKIWYVSPLNRSLNYAYGTPNANGTVHDDYYDAAVELAATRSSWMEVLYGKDYVSLSNLPDGLHPNGAGHVEVHDNLLAAYNS